ncbi:MAG: nitroreductase family protein [Candidatus Diapherotrites archaeon]|nr:nitroreductase family protein [Candidatus Diapherotrites archaeon]
MGFFDLIKKRVSVRKFEAKPVPQETIDKLTYAINRAPSAGNLQSYSVLTVKTLPLKKKLAKACFSQGFVEKAPILMVFFADCARAEQRYNERGEFYAVQDATIAASYAQLAAVELGIASCWIGAFDEKAIQKIANAQDFFKPVAVLAIGFSAEKPKQSVRRQPKEIFFAETEGAQQAFPDFGKKQKNT